MVHGLSVKMSDVGRAFGGPAEYWYGKVRTVPFAQAAGDLLDEGIAISFLSTQISNLNKTLGISLEANGLVLLDSRLEQLLLWVSIGSDGNVGLRGAILLPATKLKQLEAALQRYQPYDMQLFMRVKGSASLETLDVSTGNSRKAFINRAPMIEAVEIEFAISQTTKWADAR